jgi:DNA-binding response OmpR family regulator
MPSRTILIVEDEIKLVEVLKANFEHHGDRVFVANDGLKALEVVENETIDLVLLDWMLPKMSGDVVLQNIRRFSRVPVIMLTARSGETDVVDGLKYGSDDYITKPFSLKELNARVEAVMRRVPDAKRPVYQKLKLDDRLIIDFDAHKLMQEGEIVHLTPNEFKILSVLVQHPQRVFTREELVTLSLGDDFDGYDRTVDTHIKNLRMKIEVDPKQPKLILTVFGVGYRFGGHS